MTPGDRIGSVLGTAIYEPPEHGFLPGDLVDADYLFGPTRCRVLDVSRDWLVTAQPHDAEPDLYIIVEALADHCRIISRPTATGRVEAMAAYIEWRNEGKPPGLTIEHLSIELDSPNLI